jgi:hypothetical protein
VRPILGGAACVAELRVCLEAAVLDARLIEFYPRPDRAIRERKPRTASLQRIGQPQERERDEVDDAQRHEAPQVEHGLALERTS